MVEYKSKTFKYLGHAKVFNDFMRARSSFRVNTWTAQSLTNACKHEESGENKKAVVINTKPQHMFC